MSAETEPSHVRGLLAVYAENVGMQAEALEVFDQRIAEGEDPWEAAYNAIIAYDLDQITPEPPTFH